MSEQSNGRFSAWLPLSFSIVLVVGMVLGFRLRDTLRQHNYELEKIVDLVNEKYVDTVSSNKLFRNAISGILQSLDPHTVYIPAEEVEGVNEDLVGNFSGIGIEFSIVRDTIEVTSVIEGGPASTAGIEVGDQLIKVEDSLVAGIGITADRIAHLLRGNLATKVNVSIKRLPGGKLEKLQLERGDIPLYSIDAGIMVDEVTGYIKINRFSATTYTEYAAALKKLKAHGAKQLIIDLRDNPGGYIDAATSIADDLLDSSKLIVYTRGIHSPRTEYKTGTKGAFEQGRLVILVDESSASASEILAGAVQDWDRGVVIGRRTFGKGLVQEQYDLPDGAALRLTVACYYTPSGRCIQRSYANGRDAYLADYDKRFDVGALTVEDTSRSADTMVYYTSGRRRVFGGGGVKPDVYVPYDTTLLSGAAVKMLYSSEMRTAIWDYFIQNKSQLKYRSIADFDALFNAQEQVVAGYLAALNDDKRAVAVAALSKPVTRDFIKVQIKAQLARFLFRDNGYYTISLRRDEVVTKALEVLHSDRYLSIISGK